jgi:hypothetical protein
MIALVALLLAQDPIPAPPPTPAPVIVVVAPLAPVDPNTPYASPRDAACHRFQVTLADVTENRNAKDGLRGFAQAFNDDRTYAAAAYNLGILAAIAEKWDDAVAALEEASKLDTALAKTAAPQLERLRLIARLEKSADGRRRRAYDEALLPLLQTLQAMPPADATAALIELGRIDPKRWEAPALLAGINGEGMTSQAAAKFLDIAIANAGSARGSLEPARKALERESQYVAARASAEAASDQGDYPKAAELYQAAWSKIPARVENGIDAASALLLTEDTKSASALLCRLRDSKDPEISAQAAAMLKQLAAIEPAAVATTSDASEFFRDAGSREPARIATLLPPIDRAPLEIYKRPLPKLVEDPEPVVLLASLSADSPQSAPLPALQPAPFSGDSPWRDATSVPRTEAPAARSIQAVDLSAGAAEPRTLQISTEPAGAKVFIGAEPPNPSCETPCALKLAPGDYPIRLALAGYRDVQTNSAQDISVPLEVIRATVIFENAAPGSIKVNGAQVDDAPEYSFVPGLYRIGANFGGSYRERLLYLKPAARLRLK